MGVYQYESERYSGIIDFRQVIGMRIGKKIIVLFLICFLSMSTVTYAAEDASLAGFTCSKGGFFPEEFNEEVDKYKEDDANMAEKFLTSQLQNLWNIGDINGLSTLVFGNPYCVWADTALKDESKIKMSADGIFTSVEKEKIITPALKMFSAVYVALMALAMMLSGLKLGFNSVRGRGLSDFGEDAKMWLISIFFIAGYGIFTNIIFEMNAAIVLSFKALLESQGVKVDQFSIMATWKDTIGVGSGGIPILSFLIVALAEWILAIVLNFVYIARKVIVLVLLILGYMAAYSLLFAKTRAFFGQWMRELIGNVFLQSIHALLLFGMAMFASLGASTIYKLGLMMMFIPLTGMISKWLKIGDTSTKMGSALTMVGLGGVMTTMALTSQAGNIMRGGNMNGGLSTMSSNNSASNETSFGGSSIAGAGGGSDSSITSITTDATGATSDSWNNSKNMLSNIGGAVFGAAGAVAGPGGVMLANKAGRAITGALVQGPRNMISGANSAVQTFKSAKGFTDGTGKTGFKAMMGNLGEKRAFYGNMGESLGAMVGAGAAGRTMGLGMSGVSRQRLSATSVANGGRGMMTDASGNAVPTTMQGMSKQYPGANMQFVQTNKGSSMWVQSPNQDWKQVGLTGAADPSLKRGEARVMDYKLAESNASYQLQPNGSYKASRMGDPMGGGAQPDKSVFHSTSGVARTPGIPSVSGPATSSTMNGIPGSTPISGISGSTATPLSAPKGIPSSSSVTSTQMVNDTSSSGPAPSGLPGSTPHVMRTSNAYTVGVGGDGTINQETLRSVNSTNAVRLTDSSFRGERINPDAFVAHHVPGTDQRSSSDRFADKVHTRQNTESQSSAKVNRSWKKASKDGQTERSTRIS